MAVPTVDGSVSNLGSPGNGFANNFTVPHTINTGLTNSILVVLAATYIGSDPASATWNGVTLTRGNFGNGTAIFWIKNPASGSHNVVVTWSPAATRWVTITCITFVNAAGVVFDSATSSSSFDINLSLTIPSSIGIDSLSVNLCMTDAASGITHGSGETEQSQFTTSGIAPNPIVYFATATKPSEPTGTDTTMSATFNAVTPSNNRMSAVQLLSATRHGFPQELIM